MIYDLIVIGGGPAGYHAAELAAKAGLNVMLAEKRQIGGVCLNEGCIPSKALLYSAKLFHGAVHGEKFGISVENAILNHEIVVNRKNKVVRTLSAGVKGRLKKCNVTVVEGAAVITGKRIDCAADVDIGMHSDGSSIATAGSIGANGSIATVGSTVANSSIVFDVRVCDNLYSCRRLLIATGAVPSLPPIPGLHEGIENGTVLTNREILDLKEIPAALTIIGGGVIGLEMALYFSTAGSHVTVLEMLDHIAGSTDREISNILLKNLTKRGVEFKLNSTVTEIKTDGVVYTSEGNAHFAPSDKVLVSIGRKADTQALGLESIGVITERGRIATDLYGRTNIEDIYAAGDVNGISMLAHTAYREAEVCINDILGKGDSMRYDAVPSVIYTDPEVAGVGETEESAGEKGIDFETAKLPMMYSGRYAAENEGGDGICKILLERQSRKVIGVHMIGNHSSEIIYGAALMIEKGMRVDDLKKVVFPHPTVSEIMKEVLELL